MIPMLTLAARAARHDRRGAAAVEFALVLPVLMLILLGIIEFGRAWNVKQTLTDAAREGARVAVVAERMNLTQQQLQDSVTRTIYRAVALSSLDSTRLTLSLNVGGNPGSAAQVGLSYNYDPIFGSWIFSQQMLQLNSTFTMRNE